MWIALDRRGWQPSIPMKMFAGLVLMSASMAVMMGAANQENRRTSASGLARAFLLALSSLQTISLPMKPKRVTVKSFTPVASPGMPVLTLSSWTASWMRTNATASSKKRRRRTFGKKSKSCKQSRRTSTTRRCNPPEVVLEQVPPGFDMKFSGLKKSVVQFKDGRLIAYQPLADKELKATPGGRR